MIELVKKVCGTKAMPILVEAWSYLINRQLCPLNQWPLAWDMNALLYLDEARYPIGVIGFQHQEWARELIINIGYVKPTARRRGVYVELWEALVSHARIEQIPTITSGTAISNEAVRRFSRSVGREETRVIIDYRVPGVPQP